MAIRFPMFVDKEEEVKNTSAKVKSDKIKRLPTWIRVKVRSGKIRGEVLNLVENLQLNTVCQSAKCPNIGECWHRGSATFMILGDRCTRACKFCAIHSFKPVPVDDKEPMRVAESAHQLGLQYVVITSVDRDDLPDKGADQFVKTIRAVRQRLPEIRIEVLTPDFKGRKNLIEKVLKEKPVVFNHNMETCRRLTASIRSGGKYDRSLQVLRIAKDLSGGRVAIKSGIMVGLSETDEEVEITMRDMVNAGVDILTIGQYLPPSTEHWKLDRYVEPEKFNEWAILAKKMGFKAVASAPMVRSSYKAEELAIEGLK